MFLQKSAKTYTVYPLLSDPDGGGTVGSDNRRAKITGLNGVGRVGLRSDN